MKTTLKKYFAIPIVCLTMLAVIFSLVGCDKGDESPRTADVSVFLVDKNDNAIANTEIVVEGISDMDIANIYATDSNGKFTIRNLGEKDLTFIIRAEGTSYNMSYTVTKSDLEQGKITIRFNGYENQSK